MLNPSLHKLFWFLIGAALLVPSICGAQVKFNEIMYDPSGSDSGREWVEIYNSGASTVDLTGWKFLESTSASNHSLSLISGSSTLTSGSYAVIVIDSAKFLIDWPNFNGNLFKASFSSLNNTGSTLILKDNSGSVVDQTTYSSDMGGSGDGNSLQLQNSDTWIGANPTPGQQNSSTVISTSTDSNTNSTSANTNDSSSSDTAENNTITNAPVSAHYSSKAVSTNKIEYTIPLNLGRDRLGSIGSPLEFSVETSFNKDRNNLFNWNFGDGATATGDVVTHSYEYPGDYIVVLNVRSPEGNGVARLNVNIVDPKFEITQANQEFIKIKNNAKSEVSLYGNALSVGNNSFVFPQDTLVKAGSEIIFSNKVTGLIPHSASEVSIIDYGNTESSKIPQKINEERNKKIALVENQISNLKSQIAMLQNNQNRNLSSLNNTQNQLTQINLSAAVINASGTNEITKESNKWIQKMKLFFLRK